MQINSDIAAPADFVAGIQAPWNATVGECLQRWSRLGPVEQSTSYIVLRGDEGVRHTLNAAAIADLARRSIGAQAR